MPSAVAVSGSPSRTSKSRRLADYALSRAGAAGCETATIDLCDLPADELLRRGPAPSVDSALARCATADVLIVSTPVYRAAYSGLLKVFFDSFQPDALARVVAVPIATGATLAHQLVLEHALGPLLASVGALVVPAGVYAVDAQFRADGVEERVLHQIDRAVASAVALVARR